MRAVQPGDLVNLAPSGDRISEVLRVCDKVVALGYQRGRVRPTNTPYAFEFVHVWTLRQGKITSFRVYYDTACVAAVLRTEPPTR